MPLLSHALTIQELVREPKRPCMVFAQSATTAQKELRLHKFARSVHLVVHTQHVQQRIASIVLRAITAQVLRQRLLVKQVHTAQQRAAVRQPSLMRVNGQVLGTQLRSSAPRAHTWVLQIHQKALAKSQTQATTSPYSARVPKTHACRATTAMQLRLFTHECASMESMPALQTENAHLANNTHTAQRTPKLPQKQQLTSAQAVMCARRERIINT